MSAAKPRLVNVNIEGSYLLPTPRAVQKLLPATQASLKTVADGRAAIRGVLDGKDDRLLLVVGPCSVHDPKAAVEYARRLTALAERVSERILVVMRVYFEKPRTTVGWKGLINDPFMNDSFHIEEGLKRARKVLLEITAMGLPAGTEALDPVTPQYLSELVCWYAIGARTVESQTHREIASGLSAPVGFKNGTDGNVQVAVNAMKASLTPHHFLGVDPRGRLSVFKTKGNSYGHIVLRGGAQPNYDAACVARCGEALAKEGLRRKILVDCSHGNSQKDFRRQPAVFQAVLDQIIAGERSLVGMMVESHLNEGSQPIAAAPGAASKLRYGVSVTDACIGWETTEALVLGAYEKLRRAPA